MKPLAYLTSRKSATQLALAALAGLLWLLAFPRADLWPLAFVGFVPLLIATERSSLRETWFLASVAGMLFQSGVCFWFIYMAEKFMGAQAPLSWAIWLAMSFWAGQALALSFVSHRLLQRWTSLPSVVTLPVATVVVWSAVPNIFYFTLSSGLWSAPTALQPMAIFGAHGLDAVIMLCNAGLFELLRMRSDDMTMSRKIGAGVALGLVVAWLGAGAAMLSDWDGRVASWEKKTIGLVQPNRESSFKQLPPEPGHTRDYPVEMEMTERLKDQGADFVIWPECHLYGTMWKKSRAATFSAHAKRLDLDLLIHDKGPDPEAGRDKQRNSSVLFRKDGSPPVHYHKRILVPFGEYYPYVGYSDYWRKTLKLPPSLWAGEEAMTFDVAGMRVEPIICYEIQFGPHVATSVGAEAEGKVIVAQSNDGWYGPGSSSAQHRAATVLRAVENRVPVIHSLNTGESTIIAPSGRVVFLAPNWVRGEYIVDMPYSRDSGGSFYASHPGWFRLAVRTATLLYLIAFFVMRRRRRADASPVD